jgi:CO/xanthine dehydrogenase Mo-binding subunit
METQRHIGTSPLRREGRGKVTGTAVYTDDLVLPGMLFGATIRTAVPRGILRGIRFEAGIPWDEFVIVTAKDIDGDNHVAVIELDQPFLVAHHVNHCEEPVVLLAHPDKELLALARGRVTLEIEPLPPVLTLDEALAGEPVVWGEDNLMKELFIEKGDVDDVWMDAAHWVEETYATGAQEQLYIEPHAMVATWSEAEGVTVWGSLQCPYYVHKALKHLFRLPDDRVRVVQMETGGGFGGKEDYPSVIAGHAALLARKAGRPVKIVYDREEDMAATTKRHPSRTHIRAAFDADGRLIALDIDFLLDGGAYVTLTPVVLSRGAIHAGGAYRCPHVRIRGRALATNTPPHGAFRGFGAPQTLFAIERHMDVAARQMGLDPLDLRRRNLLRMGDTTATGQVIREPIDLPGLLDRCLDQLDYTRRHATHHASNHGPVKRGLGVATFMHGCGFTGGGESYLASVAGVEGRADGFIHVLAGSTEIGQGAHTVFTQVVAEALRVPLECVRVAQPDTQVVPNSGPTVASRTSMVVGKLLQDAAVSLRQLLIQSGLLKEPYNASLFQQAVKTYLERFGPLRAFCQYQAPPHIHWDDQLYRGDAYATFAWAAYGAEVAVDTRTGEVRVEDFVAVQEVGRVIHPLLAAGQIEGGVAQGIGWGLTEEVVWRQGRMANAQMTNYIMATAMDLPRIRVYFEESPYAGGPGGAKGIGELPLDGPAPALLNAVQDALGRSDLREIPLTPERVLDLLAAPVPVESEGFQERRTADRRRSPRG